MVVPYSSIVDYLWVIYQRGQANKAYNWNEGVPTTFSLKLRRFAQETRHILSYQEHQTKTQYDA